MDSQSFLKKIDEEEKSGASLKNCGHCGNPIPPMDDPGDPHFMLKEGVEVQVHADCYYDNFGKEIDKHPIGGRRRPRGC